MAPAAILGAVAIGSAALSVFSQVTQSNVQNKIFKNTQAAAVKSTIAGYDQTETADNQRRDQAGQQVQQNALAAARARASAQAAAGSSDISGISVDAIQQELSQSEGTNYSNILTNKNNADAQSYYSELGIQASGTNAARSVAPGNFNPVVGLLQIGAAGASSYYGAQVGGAKSDVKPPAG